MADLELARDVLDKQLLDRDGVAMGRVDGLILDVSKGRQPRVACLEVGSGSLLRRVHPRLGEWAERAARRLGVSSGEPLRLSPSQITQFGRDLHVDLDAPRSDAFAWERWLRDRFIRHIPGCGP